MMVLWGGKKALWSRGPFIAVMEAAEDRPANELAGLPTVSDFRRPQGQAPVRPISIVVTDELPED
jgi:hypothetical protein